MYSLSKGERKRLLLALALLTSHELLMLDQPFDGLDLTQTKGVMASAYFPYAVAKDIPDFHDGEISIRFEIVAGQLDQCAGILFNLKPNGDYPAVRFNGMEDNVVLWTFNKGVRKFVKKGSEKVVG